MTDQTEFIMGLDASIFETSDVEDTPEMPPSVKQAPIHQEPLSEAAAATLIGRNNILPNSKYYLVTTEYETIVSRLDSQGTLREFKLEEDKPSRHDNLDKFTVRSTVLPQEKGKEHVGAMNVMLIVIGLLFLVGIGVATWLFTI